jgi:hypothetical protein
MQEFLNCFIKTAIYFSKKEVGQHHRNRVSTCFGMVGQHVPESTLTSNLIKIFELRLTIFHERI